VRHVSSAVLWRSGRRALGATILGLGLGVGCSDAGQGASGEQPPNIVLVLVDTLRADHTSLYGYERATTPNLERIAAEGLVMRNHMASAAWTKPSVASIITGLHPSAHGSRVGLFKTMERLEEMRAKGRNPTVDVLGESHECLAEALAGGGYHTAALINNFHLTPKFGYHQGYEDYRFTPGKFDDKGFIDATIQVLKDQDGPAFVWCHTMSVHQYINPEGFDVFKPEGATPIPADAPHAKRVKRYSDIETPVAEYDNSILYVDSLIGELFDYIKAEEPNTILIITADHGEEFFDHGSFEHGHTLYNELVRVPLVIWGPGVPVGEVTGITDSIDIFPTLLAAAGVTPTADLDGQLLFEDGQATRGKLESFAEKHWDNGPKRFLLVREGGKLIVNQDQKTGEETFEFYADPMVDTDANVVESMDPAEVDRYRQRLQVLQDKAAQHFTDTVGDKEVTNLDAYDVQQLKELGYIH
jgi:arylsulfatase A-like enzyme